MISIVILNCTRFPFAGANLMKNVIGFEWFFTNQFYCSVECMAIHCNIIISNAYEYLVFTTVFSVGFKGKALRNIWLNNRFFIIIIIIIILRTKFSNNASTHYLCIFHGINSHRFYEFSEFSFQNLKVFILRLTWEIK